MDEQVLTLGDCVLTRHYPSGEIEVTRADKYIHIAAELLSEIPVENGLLKLGDINTVYYRVIGAPVPVGYGSKQMYVEALRVD